ncbi:12815_t:CDS:1, partial [Racocetra fulgida]
LQYHKGYDETNEKIVNNIPTKQPAKNEDTIEPSFAGPEGNSSRK